MQFASIVMAAAIGLGCCALADADAGVDAGTGRLAVDHGAGAWTEAQSLRELPAGIQALLGVGLGEEGGIADRGDRFNTGDLIGSGLPQRRFALGAVNGDTAVVAVERGGRGYHVQTVEFRHIGATWEPVRCTVGAAAPRHSEELLEIITTHRSAVPGACQLPGFLPEPATTAAVSVRDGSVTSVQAPQPRFRPRPGS